MIFVGGIHGVGKTYFCEKMSRNYGKINFSSGELIQMRRGKRYQNKRVQDIDSNQKLLLEEVLELKEKIGDFILDGHLCLLNKNGQIKCIGSQIFRELGIDLLIVVIDRPAIIKRRLEGRDGMIWSENFIYNFQKKEIESAKHIAEQLKIDYHIVVSEEQSFEKFGQSIILPIKSNFAKKILSGDKIYEYRKKICSKNIDKIYLYETSPIQRIVGECDVIALYCMEKERMWKKTRNNSGISKEFFDEYYKNDYWAKTYVLNNPQTYVIPKKLIDFNIKYIPQSYVYIPTV